MRLIKIMIGFFLFFQGMLWAQDCNCKSNFEWVKKTFEENDAGFQYVLDRKGNESYEKHNKETLLKITAVKNNKECLEQIYEWMRFFRSGHIAIRSLQNNTESTLKNNVVNWETLDEKEIVSFEKKTKDIKEASFEGVWVTNPYTIGIKKEGDSYTGFILESGAKEWKRGEVKLKFSKNEGVFYLRDKSETPITSIKIIGKNHLELGRFLLKRIKPYFEEDKEISHYFETMNTDEPFLEVRNENTLVLRIPSFNNSYKKQIDSIIATNKQKIISKENLIIDLRNNGGGSDSSFQEILPLLYTNPIRTVGAEMYSTKLNNQRMLDFINNTDYNLSDEDKKWAKEAYEKLEKAIGGFVNLNEHKITETQLDTIYQFPKNVGILINKNNGSTTEQFLLAAKQSKKVKLFGTTTYGVLDISNMYFVNSPCDEFKLGYCLSKSMRIPDMAIDDKGIQPDYYIDESVPDYKWIEYTERILN